MILSYEQVANELRKALATASEMRIADRTARLHITNHLMGLIADIEETIAAEAATAPPQPRKHEPPKTSAA